jgi:hypothetical protein
LRFFLPLGDGDVAEVTPIGSCFHPTLLYQRKSTKKLAEEVLNTGIFQFGIQRRDKM